MGRRGLGVGEGKGLLSKVAAGRLPGYGMGRVDATRFGREGHSPR